MTQKMKSAELADTLLKLAQELSPNSRIIVAIIPPDAGDDATTEDDGPTLDMCGVDHFDIADVIGEMGLWLAEMVAVSLRLEGDETGGEKVQDVDKPS